MNGLTLRISTDKRIKPIKREIEIDNINSLLPSNVIDETPIFEGLVTSTTVEDQARSIKEIINTLCTNETAHTSVAIESLVHLFLHLKVKSPLVNPLLRFITSPPAPIQSVVQDAFLSQLRMKMKSDLSLKDINDFSSILLLLFDSKDFWDVTLSACQSEAIHFVTDNLFKCHLHLRSETIPIKKLEIINCIHSLVRIGIFVTQKVKVDEAFQSLSETILLDSDLPIDTRGASGILLAHITSHDSLWVQTLMKTIKTQNALGILSYCSGLLSVLPENELRRTIENDEEKTVTVNFIFKTVVTIEGSNASESGIVLVATRCVVLVTRSLNSLCVSDIEKILNQLLIFLWSHIEHYMDAVRHLATSALSNLQSVAVKYPELKIFERILEDLGGMSVEKKGKHAAISVLASHVPIATILTQSPGLTESLMAAALASPSSNYAINSLENLMRQNFKEEQDKLKWFDYWVVPLLSSQLSAPLEQLLTSVLKIDPVCIQHIVSSGLNESDKRISVLLTCLKIARKQNILKGRDELQKWKGLVLYDVLQRCMYHSNEDVRLSCFSLIVETSKSSEEFTMFELELIKTFLTYNFANQEPAVRQQSLALCKKFLTRMRDSQGALIRRQSKTPRSEETHENLTLILAKYSKLLEDVRTMCLDSLFPGASPPRRSFAFGLLIIYKDLGFWSQFDSHSAQVLLSCLLDSYEENKAMATDLLACMPKEILKFDDKKHVEKYLQETLVLSSSVRPPDSISAAYYMHLLASYDGLMNELPYGSSYFCLNATLNALEKESNVAKDSLLKAASSGPLYGHLFVIRHLLSGLNFREVGMDSQWRILVQKIIETAFECNSVVANVVYNSSPEGHLPMDFTYSHLKSDDDPQVTSQMVLLCSWRTVKEVSLLLGELSERATITGEQTEEGLLSPNQILAIGEHLTELLSETKHRGAFEQAYLGFSKLTARLWRCSSSLHELPTKWLEGTLQSICSNENLSATRRSAGIPFIIQALISSEMNNGSGSSLRRAMTFLLELAKGKSGEGRVHALNILRALYRGSTLGEAVGPFVADGIATAVSGFNAHSWAERNSSTLLLSALMSRVFGVPRGKSETLSWRNKMTGRLFFQRYPTLYGELLNHLEASANSPMYPALYPVLLLLGRIYPSSLEGTDSNLQLLNYLPFVMKCAESSILKTRALAASAVASLIASSSYVAFINELVCQLQTSASENHRHGILLMILKLIQQSSSFEEPSTETMTSNICTWLDSLIDILNSPKASYISKDTAIQIILCLLSDYYSIMPGPHIFLLEKIVFHMIFYEFYEKSVHEYGTEIFHVHLCLLLFLINFKDENISELIHMIVKLLQSDCYELFRVTLEFIFFVMNEPMLIFTPEIHQSLKIKFNNTSFSNKLGKEIRDSLEVRKVLLKRVLNPIHNEDLMYLLKTLQYFPDVFLKSANKNPILLLSDISREVPSPISCQAIKCLNAILISQGDLTVDNVATICDMVEEYSDPEADYECREAVACFISNNFDILLKGASSVSILTIWIAASKLLLDEIPEVRQVISSKLTPGCVPSRGIEVLMRQFMVQNETSTTIAGLLYWAVGEDNQSLEDGFDDSVFDKGAPNSYIEEIVLNRLACSLLAELISNRNDILTLLLDENSSEWLYSKTGIQGSCVKEFIEKYSSSMVKCDNVFELLPYRPNLNKNYLQFLKLQNLEKVLKT